ncbi:condensation domain-containing protein, partial [Streptomyces hyaluromycini]
MTAQVYPMTLEQESIWLDDQLSDGPSAYLEPWVLQLRGDVDRRAVHRAFAALVARHDALRSRFVLAGEEPVQIVEPAPADPPLPRMPCSPETVDACLRAFMRRPLDLGSGAVRAVLLEPDPDTVLLAVQLHHVVVDDWAFHTLDQEFAEFYRAFVAGRPPELAPAPPQPGPFALAQRSASSDPAALAYWRETLR